MIKLCIVLLFVVILDQGSKWATWHYLPSMQGYPLFPFGGLELFHNFHGIDGAIVNHANKGAALGFLAEHQEFLLGFRLALVLAILIWLIFLNKVTSYLFPVALIVSGALSNILDYFFYGHVVDMLYFRFWGYDYPVFNIADSAICIGTVLLLFRMRGAKKA